MSSVAVRAVPLDSSRFFLYSYIGIFFPIDRIRIVFRPHGTCIPEQKAKERRCRAVAQQHNPKTSSHTAFFRLSNRHIAASLHRKNAPAPSEYGFSSIGDLALYAMIGTVLSNPRHTYAGGGLQHLLLRHTKNRYFSLHGAFRRLSCTGYLQRTRIPEGKNCFHDYYTLAHTQSDHPDAAERCLTYTEGAAFRTAYRPFDPPREDYTEVSVPMLMDPSLSLAAKGLYIIIARYLRLCTYRPEIVLSKDMLRCVCGMGANAFDRIFRELRTSGYLVLQRTKSPETGYPMYSYLLQKTGTADDVPKEPSSAAADSKQPLPADRTAADPRPTAAADRSEELLPSSGLSAPQSLQQIRHTIDYDCLVQEYPRQRLDTVVSILSSYLSSPPHSNAVISIGGTSYPSAEIASRMSKLDSEDIRFVLDTYQDVAKTKEIRSIRRYLTACLFHAKENLALALDALAIRTPGASYQ